MPGRRPHRSYLGIDQFFRLRPEYNTRIFLAGGSYAGHFIPPLAAKLKQRGSVVRLQGILLGNPSIAPEIQWRSFPKVLLENGIVSREEFELLEKQAENCASLAHMCDLVRKALDANETVDPCLLENFERNCRSMYGDVVVNRELPAVGLFDEISFIVTIWIRNTLGKMTPWNGGCDIPCRYDHLLPDLLDGGMRVLVYAGDRDLMCNWMGNQAWMEELDWRGADGFRRARPVEYKFAGGRLIGELRSFALPDTGGQLIALKVYGAGHTVARDAPAEALKMLDDFLKNKL
ncbi:hypothetical protein FOZ61_003012 [Perkinsus olseni]|uniref:Uncharacterized protein n=1 Tax=Perkinsus olseni TaxID=32597 RepID=A0A7J6MEG1_PEROL|nr:hypothetical protein FOZ61_003012 [Perkinsus olseni]KAF4674820.1 hypothetical protein FOL46_003812 [Perkinsus olseni]